MFGMAGPEASEAMTTSRKRISKDDAMDQKIRETCKILQSIAKTYPRGSAEREALREAVDAFVYLELHKGLKRSYEAFRRSCTKPLTKAQQQVLKRAGVEL